MYYKQEPKTFVVSAEIDKWLQEHNFEEHNFEEMIFAPRYYARNYPYINVPDRAYFDIISSEKVTGRWYRIYVGSQGIYIEVERGNNLDFVDGVELPKNLTLEQFIDILEDTLTKLDSK